MDKNLLIKTKYKMLKPTKKPYTKKVRGIL